MRALRWDGGELREVTCCSDRRYDDAYTIQKVEMEHVISFNFVAGVVPFLQSLIDGRRNGKLLAGKETFKICHALRELRNFMLVNGEPCKAKQKLLRNLRVFLEAYGILHTYMLGNSRKNALYFAKYIEFFQTQMGRQTHVSRCWWQCGQCSGTISLMLVSDLALKVTKMLVELMKDNRKIVDRISHEQMEVFVELLRKNERGVYVTERGQNIDKKPNETYVSCDQMKSWIPLVEFVQPDESDTEGMERCLFLRTQLDLFISLC
uniref:RYDR_ITPR domain-containing protein n=1 Tax=Macrostomum lignano TaxID=282301 RepID=A0A1I8FAX0_9PLAT